MKTIYDLEFRIYTIHANKYNYLLPSAIRIILYYTNYNSLITRHNVIISLIVLLQLHAISKGLCRVQVLPARTLSAFCRNQICSIKDIGKSTISETTIYL